MEYGVRTAQECWAVMYTLIADAGGVQDHAGDNIYVFYGSLDEPYELPPKGEFVTKHRAEWMPEIPGKQASFVWKLTRSDSG